MANWLLQEEMRFAPSLMVQGFTRADTGEGTAPTRVITLRNVTVLDNRRLFGNSDVIVHTVVVDGYPDMKSGQPFWVHQLDFSNVADGAVLSIDPDLGVQIYRGVPADFLNLYVLVVRDTQASRRLAKMLRKNLMAESVGVAAGAAISIFAKLPPQITVPAARELVTKAVNTTLDYFGKKKNVVIGVYYASLLKELKYGAGMHPASYPSSRLNCGGAVEIAYEVRTSA